MTTNFSSVRILRACMYTLAAILLWWATEALAAPFYEETFSFDGSIFPYNAQSHAGWKAFTAGSRVGVLGNLKISIGLVRNEPAYNSFPTGPDDGYSLWVKPAEQLTVFTDEYSFSVGALDKVSYLQRLSGGVIDPVTLAATLDGTRLAFRINGSDNTPRWYISDEQVRQQKIGVWELVSVSPQSLGYGIVTTKGDVGPAAPAAGNAGQPLPAHGVVSAFGVFVDKVNGRVRTDNFKLSDDLASNGIHPQPTPTRRPNVPQPTPGGDDNEPEPTPGMTTPTPTVGISSDQKRYSFCTASKKTSSRVLLSRSARAAVLRTMRGSSAQALRNRIIVEAVLARGIRASSLENVRVEDFYLKGNSAYLDIFGTESRSVRVSSRLAKYLRTYIAKAGIASDAQSPLLRRFSSKGALTLSATCRAELSRIVSRAVKKARLR